jgi:ubiquinol-cytochrome c reductase cytochrome b subunit
MKPGTDQRVLATVMRDVPNGRWLRIAHANGASLFFMVVYVHMIRAFYYSSWSAPNEAVWLLGIALLLLMIITAFIGYVLPWGRCRSGVPRSSRVWLRCAYHWMVSAFEMESCVLVVGWLRGGHAVGGSLLFVARYLAVHHRWRDFAASCGIAHLW